MARDRTYTTVAESVVGRGFVVRTENGRMSWRDLFDALDLIDDIFSDIFSRSEKKQRVREFGQSEPEDRRIVVWLTVGAFAFVILLAIIKSIGR